MKALIEILKKETESLRIQYLEMTEKWAKEQCIRNIERKNRYAILSTKLIETIGKNGYYEEQKYYYNTPSWHFQIEQFVPKMLKEAENHYENSIEKLAYRIEKKGMNQNNIKVETARIGLNINTTLTDGIKTVKAFTIIASGEIQRPHYRYLIK